MTILKTKIKTIASLPPSPKDQEKKSNFIISIIFITIFTALSYLIYTKLTPYIFAVKINKIEGKKININTCNTKDYVIIGKDKSYSMSLTNNECIQNNYEGDLYIKDRTIIFTYIIEKEINTSKKDKIKYKIYGTIDKNYNIIINNNLFEKEKENEQPTTTNIK